MSPKRVAAYRIDDEILDALRDVQDREGIPAAEQVRRALLAWLKTKGVSPKETAKPRPSKRRKV